MKNLLFFALAVFIGFSCTKGASDNSQLEKSSIISNDQDLKTFDDIKIKEIEIRSTKSVKDYLVRDFGNQIGIYEVQSGNFFYCADCNNSMDLQQDDRFNGTVELHPDGTILYVYDDQGSSYFSISLDRRTTDHLTSQVWQNVPNYSVGTVGWSIGNILGSPNDGSIEWIPSTLDDLIASLPLCQCVGMSSTPCTASGGDQTDGCDVGGPGATGCSAGSGGGGNASIGGTGAGVSSSSSCGITCGDDMYACCDYTGG